MQKYIEVLEKDKVKKYQIIVDEKKFNCYLNNIKEKFSEEGIKIDLPIIYNGGNLESYFYDCPWCDEIIDIECIDSGQIDMFRYIGGSRFLTCNVKYKEYPTLYYILSDDRNNILVDLYNYITNNIELEANKDPFAKADYILGETKYEYDKNISFNDKIRMINYIIDLMKFKLVSENKPTQEEKENIIKDSKKIKELLNILGNSFNYKKRKEDSNSKKSTDSYSQYDCELAYDDYDKQESSYLDVEHYSTFVSDEDMEIPKGFDPSVVPVNLEDNSRSNNNNKFIFKRPTRENGDNVRPISSFTNEPSVFYNEEHDKAFSKRFRLIKGKDEQKKEKNRNK